MSRAEMPLDEEIETAARRFARLCMREFAARHGLDKYGEHELIAINDACDDTLAKALERARTEVARLTEERDDARECLRVEREDRAR